MLGAQIHWCGARRKGEDIPGIVERLKAEGKTPYVVPYGGSSAVGVFGYVDAMREACAQLEEAGETITHMVFASSSGATHAGLDFDDIQFELGVSTQCGRCEGCARDIVAQCRATHPQASITCASTPQEIPAWKPLSLQPSHWAQA